MGRLEDYNSILFYLLWIGYTRGLLKIHNIIIIRRLVTLAEHTSDHGKQTNSSTKKRVSMARKLLGANAKSYRLKLKMMPTSSGILNL